MTVEEGIKITEKTEKEKNKLQKSRLYIFTHI